MCIVVCVTREADMDRMAQVGILAAATILGAGAALGMAWVLRIHMQLVL